jgi:hypothetical protein
VNFFGEFSHCGYKCFFEEIGKIRFSSVRLRKKCSKNGMKSRKFTNRKNEEKRKRKRKNWYRGIYVCTLNKLWKNIL